MLRELLNKFSYELSEEEKQIFREVELALGLLT